MDQKKTLLTTNADKCGLNLDLAVLYLRSWDIILDLNIFLAIEPSSAHALDRFVLRN